MHWELWAAIALVIFVLVLYATGRPKAKHRKAAGKHRQTHGQVSGQPEWPDDRYPHM